MRVTMTEHLASLFGSAVGMLPSTPARSLDLFTEVTNFDESACDAWIGRIRCGDTERVKVVVDESGLAPSALHLVPFDIVGGERFRDILNAPRRFFQYQYSMRVLGEALERLRRIGRAGREVAAHLTIGRGDQATHHARAGFGMAAAALPDDRRTREWLIGRTIDFEEHTDGLRRWLDQVAAGA
mgnify:CR=1 FL=1